MKKLKLTEKDLKRYKNYTKSNFPDESIYSSKEKITKYEKKIYSAPTCINLEITEACNVKCKHCYNPWRDEHAGKFSLDNEKIDFLIDQFDKSGVFHVILSGGEPLSKYKELCYMLEQLTKRNISTSINSNLMLATPEKMEKLKELGADHVLTSWFSYFPNETDDITTYKGSFKKIVDGIKTTIAAGIRVSANTICTQHNKGTIYKSGKFLNSLGVSQFFAHRVIPPAYDRKDKDNQHYITRDQALETLDDLLKLKKETGMNVGTLINYPLCMLGDLEKYQDFVGRGCPTQSGHRFNINSNGDTHGCVMEDKNYGNIYSVGLKEAYQATLPWRTEKYLFEGCKGCHYIDVCHSGCRMHAFSNSGKMDGQDPFMPGKEHIVKPFKFKENKSIINKVKNGAKMYVSSDIRFRKEKDFYLLNIRWANTIEITNEEATFFINKQNNKEKFTVEDFNISDNPVARLANLLSKEAIKSKEIELNIRKTGVNIDPVKLPDLTSKSFKTSHPNIKLN